MTPVANGKPMDTQKSWKKISEERKALKKKRKQERLLKELENAEKLKELATVNAFTSSDSSRANPSTISIAVPGSILENAQSMELRSYVAGQIARAACVFRVNEVIVFDDVGIPTAKQMTRNYAADEDASEEKTVRSSSLQLARILQYLECPQYLRKFFFPLHKDLKYSGLLNPLDAPHHLRQQNVFPYREGIVSEKKAKAGYSYVNVGLLHEVLVNKELETGVRVTVKLDISTNEQQRKMRGTLVSPEEPRRVTGAYWGYTVRIAHSVSEIFTKSPYESGYDLTIGTSDRGTSIHEVPAKSCAFNHLLIVFGGLKGLEAALANDDKLKVDDPQLLFDHYVNVVPKQGSRTIRTEEALLIALSALQEKLKPHVDDIEENLKEFLPQSDDTGIKVTQFQAKNMKNRLLPKVDGETEEKKTKRGKKMEHQNSKNTNEQDFEIAAATSDENLKGFLPQSEDTGINVTQFETKKIKNPFSAKIADERVERKTKRRKEMEHEDSNNTNEQDFEIVAATTDVVATQEAESSDYLSRFD